MRQRVDYTSFQYLLDKKESRKSENVIGRYIEYSQLKMAEYLNSTQTDMSIDNCPNEVFTQKHLLYCSYLLGKNELLTYIPDYKDLFNGEMEDQVYISRLLKGNYMRMKDQKTMWTGADSMFYCDISYVTVLDPK